MQHTNNTTTGKTLSKDVAGIGTTHNTGIIACTSHDRTCITITFNTARSIHVQTVNGGTIDHTEKTHILSSGIIGANMF